MTDKSSKMLGTAAGRIGRELGALAADAETIGRLLTELEGAAAVTWPNTSLAIALANVREALTLVGPAIALSAMAALQEQLVAVAVRLDGGAGDRGEALGLGLILAGVRAVEAWLRLQVAVTTGPVADHAQPAEGSQPDREVVSSGQGQAA